MANTPASNTSETPEAAEPKKRSGLLGKLKIGGFVFAVVGLECALAWLYIPSAAEVQARLEEEAGIVAEEEMFETPPAPEADGTLEVALGEYGVTCYQPESNTVLRIDFSLFGTIQEGDNEDYTTRYGRNENRIREQVLVTTRNSNVTDLTDPNLALLKRRILETANRTLGKPLLMEVGFGDFSFIEQ